MPSALRSVWRQPRPPGARSAGRTDAALVAGIAVLAVIEALVRDELPWRWLALATLIAWLPTLLWRRSRPLVMPAVFALVTGCDVLITGGEPVELHTAAFALLMPYSLARWGTGRETVLGLAVFLGAAAVSMASTIPPPGDVAGAAAVIGTAIALGVALRYRSLLRDRQLEGVRRDERERLARDLHDTIAHHLSAIAVSAQAGQAVASSRPEAAVEALRRIETEASRTLSETRQVVRLLRYDDSHGHEAGTLADLADLAPAGGVGPRVEVSVADGPETPATLSAALYRIAQEAISNARRHARGAETVSVEIHRDGGDVRLTVRDDGHDAAAAPRGFGLLGMAERAALLGGRLEAGPGPDGGWVVTAVLPEEPR